ncbi:hypothetical protein [Ancylobacter oerskovii]|uniref:ANTAR domain-containing protein n=1 Tax=Ancylobacter oerskovii TaxID=459519 RepID=A0ABW4Z209_9HYPH|nr:hypothetical protein [Ancylobacter oerskovii]MBS7542559.1 hypothetical protein [Ancylobacter oerskovii]
MISHVPIGSADDLRACAIIARREGDMDAAERFLAGAARIEELERHSALRAMDIVTLGHQAGRYAAALRAIIERTNDSIGSTAKDIRRLAAEALGEG